jgi:molybdate transport system substrate-binding protein
MPMNGEANPALTGISSMATRAVLNELCAWYARETGQRVNVGSAGGVDAFRRVREGEPFDIVVLASEAIERLAEADRVDPRTRRALVRADIAIAVRAGATRPDIGSEEAVRAAVLTARAIGHSTGPSGAYLMRLLERWGVAERVAARLVQAPPGVPVATLVARGAVDLGFQQLSELVGAPGIDVVGLLPPALRHATVFAGAVCTASGRRQDATTLLAFLASDATDATKRRYGLEPAPG